MNVNLPVGQAAQLAAKLLDPKVIAGTIVEQLAKKSPDQLDAFAAQLKGQTPQETVDGLFKLAEKLVGADGITLAQDVAQGNVSSVAGKTQGLLDRLQRVSDVVKQEFGDKAAAVIEGVLAIGAAQAGQILPIIPMIPLFTGPLFEQAKGALGSVAQAGDAFIQQRATSLGKIRDILKDVQQKGPDYVDAIQQKLTGGATAGVDPLADLLGSLGAPADPNQKTD